MDVACGAGGCGYWRPDIVQCYNTGSDGYDASWKCEASMPEGYSFSWIEVRLRHDGDAYRRRTRRSTLLDSWAGELSRSCFPIGVVDSSVGDELYVAES